MSPRAQRVPLGWRERGAAFRRRQRRRELARVAEVLGVAAAAAGTVVALVGLALVVLPPF